MRILRMAALAIAAAFIAATSAEAQKGTGETTGVARQATKPAIQEMSGTVTDVIVGACANTTGGSVQGAHLSMRTDAGQLVELHLGPLDAVEDIVEQVPAGTRVSFEAFRTEAMPADTYVAKSITVDDEVLRLRDDTLRPTWAGGRGRGAGMGMGQGSGRGMGQGSGRGMGQGSGGGGSCWW